MSGYDVAVIGGGPAGLAAATYVHRVQLNVVLCSPVLRGKVGYSFGLRGTAPIQTVWGAELVQQFSEYIQQEVHYLPKEVKKVERGELGGFRLDVQDNGLIEAKSVIIATGTQPQRLHIPGEEEFMGRGVSFSALSHAPFFVGRNVAIIGYGPRALIATLSLASLANQVYFVPTRELAKEDNWVTQVKRHSNIVLLNGWGVERILGDDYVTGIQLIGGIRANRTLSVDGVFVELGLSRNNELVRGLVTLDPETGCIGINQRCETETPGLFAAGDVTNIYSEQVPVATGEGIKAALSAQEYLVTCSK